MEGEAAGAQVRAAFFPRGLASRVARRGVPETKPSSNEYDRLHCGGEGAFFVVRCLFRFSFFFARSGRDLLIDLGFRVVIFGVHSCLWKF